MPRPLIFKNQKKPKAMPLKVKFDRILGRLREKDGDSTPTPPAPSHSMTGSTTPDRNQTYLADAQTSPGMTVTVKTYFDGALVDVPDTPANWTRTALGTYTRRIEQSGTIPAQTWTYPYQGQNYTYTSPARSLSAVYPAYWGIYPSNDATPDIRAIVADLAGQHRETANVNRTVAVPNPTGSDCWLWIVTHGSATATPESFDISMMRDPVTGKSFTSPVNPSINLSGYKAYVSINPADAGLSFGNVKLKINL